MCVCLFFSVGPVYQRTPERGMLCFEFIYNEYLGQWLTAKTINAHFYTKAREELDALKKSKYGKQVAAQKPVTVCYSCFLYIIPCLIVLFHIPYPLYLAHSALNYFKIALKMYCKIASQLAHSVNKNVTCVGLLYY